jgi:hypothetical protein
MNAGTGMRSVGSRRMSSPSPVGIGRESAGHHPRCKDSVTAQSPLQHRCAEDATSRCGAPPPGDG